MLDSGADDPVLPLDLASSLQVNLEPDAGYTHRWRGKRFPVRFGRVELEITDDSLTLRWEATVIFSPAPIGYVLLGDAGCLQYFDARFCGVDRVIEIDTNAFYAGIHDPTP